MTDKDLRIGDVVMTNGQTYGTKKGELYIVTKIDSEVYVLRKDEQKEYDQLKEDINALETNLGLKKSKAEKPLTEQEQKEAFLS